MADEAAMNGGPTVYIVDDDSIIMSKMKARALSELVRLAMMIEPAQ